MRYLCPKNLDIKEVLGLNPTSKKIKRYLNEENMIFIIDLLGTLPFKRPDLVDENGFVPLSSTLLSEKITGYRGYLQRLVDLNILETNNSFVSKSISTVRNPARCKGYRLLREYDTEFVEVERNSQRLLRLNQGINSLNNREKKNYSHLLRWFNTDRLRIDREKALDQNEYEYNGIKNNPDKWEFKTIKDPWGNVEYTNERKDPYYSYSATKKSIEAFSDKNYSFAVSKNCRRFYSSLTNLKKEYRKYVTFDGRPLVSVDLSNCQPYLFLILFNTDFWNNNEGGFSSTEIKQHHLTRRFTNAINNLSPKLNTNNFPMLDILKEIITRENFYRYRSEVTEGKFYQNFFDTHSISDKSDCLFDEGIEDIEGLKLAYLKYLNSGYRHHSSVGKALEMDYPEVAYLLKVLKKSDSDTRRGQKVNGVSKLLLNLESTLFLFKIARTIAQEFPDLPVYTIHDCVVTIVGYEGIVQKVMEEEFEQCVGIKPHVKVEKWV
jgi:hypothetical protein